MKRSSRDRVICVSAVLNCFLVVLILSVISLAIARIVIGFKHLKKCEGQRMIPIYLIVSGMSPALLSAFRRSQYTKDDESIKRRVAMSLGILAIVFNFAWLVAGSIWVYGTYNVGRCMPGESDWSANTTSHTTTSSIYGLNSSTYEYANDINENKPSTTLPTRITYNALLSNTNSTTFPGNGILLRATTVPNTAKVTNNTPHVPEYDDGTRHGSEDPYSHANSTAPVNDKQCVICDEYVLAFSFAMVTFDWTLLGVFIIYIIIACLRRSLKAFADYDCPFL